MGHVDRFDKNYVLFRLRLKRCIKRYHRSIFMWYLAVILNNILCLFDSLFPDVNNLKTSMESSGLGYKHWFQDELGGVLIVEGLRLAEEKLMQRAASTITRFIRSCGNKGATASRTTNINPPPNTRRL